MQKIFTKDNYPIILFTITSFLFIFFNTINISLPILEQHSFRQTQTALTAYYFKENGFSFNYETPVVGYPWSIPFEFPIYQWLVALFSNIFNQPLTVSGRAVSLIFGFLSVIPIYKTLKLLGISRNISLYILSLFLSTPVYIFWSGTFMIESTALFFTLLYIYFSIKLCKNNNKNYLNFFIFITLTIALLQKPTSVIPAVIFFSVVHCINFYKKTEKKINFLYIILSHVAAVIILYLWTIYADSLKELNPFASQHLTSRALSSWNWGNLEQRFSFKIFWWRTIIRRTIFENAFHIFGVLIIIFSLLASKSKKKILIGSCLILFMSHFLIFTNLHIRHNYYQYSNIVYYLVALGISMDALHSNLINNNKYFKTVLTRKISLILPIGFSIIILYGYYSFYKVEYAKARFQVIDSNNNRVLKISNFIKNNTDKGLPIIIFGNDWSSTYAFYSERRALTVQCCDFDSDVLNNTDYYLPQMKIGAIINCYDGVEKKPEIIDNIVLNKYKMVQKNISGCNVYTP